MAQSDKIEVLLNPVTFLEADEGWIFGREGEAPSPDEVLKFLCSPEVKSETKNLVRRYRDISGTEGKRLLVAPADHDILTKLVTPLRHGITSYMLGNYLGTIALCGAICEMLAIFWYDLARVKTPQGVMERKTQELMYGRSFPSTAHALAGPCAGMNSLNPRLARFRARMHAKAFAPECGECQAYTIPNMRGLSNGSIGQDRSSSEPGNFP